MVGNLAALPALDVERDASVNFAHGDVLMSFWATTYMAEEESEGFGGSGSADEVLQDHIAHWMEFSTAGSSASTQASVRRTVGLPRRSAQMVRRTCCHKWTASLTSRKAFKGSKGTIAH